MRRFIASFALCLSTCAFANAQFGDLTYNFYSPSGNAQNISSVSALNFTTTVSVSNGPSVVTGTTNMFNASGWPSSFVSTSSSGYMSFSINTAQAISIPTITVNTFSNASGPQSLVLYSSLDGYTTQIDSVKSLSQGSITTSTFTLPSIPTYNNIAGSTTASFRFYAYNGTTGGEFGFISQSPSTSDSGITMSILAPVPEPTSMIALSCVGLSALGFKLRRKKVAAV